LKLKFIYVLYATLRLPNIHKNGNNSDFLTRTHARKRARAHAHTHTHTYLNNSNSSLHSFQ
jgi:hypothetical protein